MYVVAHQNIISYMGALREYCVMQILDTDVFYFGLQYQFLIISSLHQRTVNQRKWLASRFLVTGLIRENVERDDQNVERVCTK